MRASAFAYPLGIPMPIFGVAFYAVAAWLAYRTLTGGPILGIATRTLLLLAGLAGVAVSAALTAAEAFVIESFCTWCLASAAASVLLLVGAMGLWRTPDDEEPVGTSGRARQQRARAQAEARRCRQRRPEDHGR